MQLLLDPDLEVGIVFSDFEEVHVPLYGLNVERMCILKDDVVVGLISLDHQVVRVLDKCVDHGTLVFKRALSRVPRTCFSPSVRLLHLYNLRF